MSQIVISLLIKELVAARNVISKIEVPEVPTELSKAVVNYYKTCKEITNTTEDQILRPIIEQQNIRKLTTRFE